MLLQIWKGGKVYFYQQKRVFLCVVNIYACQFKCGGSLVLEENRAKKLLSLLNSHTPRLQFQEVIWCQTFAMFLFIMSDTAETDMHPWTHSCQTVNVNLFLVTLFALISMGLPDICQFWCTHRHTYQAKKGTKKCVNL